MYMGMSMIRKDEEIWHYSTVSPHTHHGFFKQLAGRPIRLHFRMRSAKLHAFQFTRR